MIPIRLKAACAAIAGLWCLGLTGCGGASATPVNDVLRLPLMENLLVDPARAYSSNIWSESLLYNGLLKFDNNLDVVPDLAVGMPAISPNGKTYTFTLRSDARFDDGASVTAGDVAFSLNRAVSRLEGSRPAWLTLRDIAGSRRVRAGRTARLFGVQVLGRRSIRVVLKHPDPRFLLDLALPAASVLESSVVTRQTEWWREGAGAGPFHILRLGNPIVLRPNPYYDQGKIDFRMLELVPTKTNISASVGYFEHKLDATPLDAPDFFHDSSLPGFVTSDTTQAYYAIESAGLPKRARVAMAEAIDRSIFSSATSQIDPLASMVPIAIVPNYSTVPDPYIFQPATARHALARAGAVALGARAQVRHSSIYTWLANTWHKSGLRLKSSDGPKDRISLVRITAPIPDPQTWLRKLGQLTFHPRNPAYNHMLAVANRAVVSHGLGAEWTADNQAETMLLNTARIIPIGIQKQGYLISTHVQGLTATPLGLEPSVENWATVTVG